MSQDQISVLIRIRDEANKVLERLDDNTSKVERGVERLGKTGGVEKLDRRVSKLNDNFSTLRGSVRRVGGAMVAFLAAGAAVRGLTALVTQAANFEEALVGVGKTVGLQGQALDALGKQITDLSHRIPVATSELLSIAEAAGQLGISGSQNIVQFTETVAKLTRTTNLGGEEAATAIARIFNVTGTAITEIDRFGSVLVALGNNFAANEQEIVNFTTELSQAVGVFDVSAREAAALGTVLKAMGQRAERSRSALQRVFQSMSAAVDLGGQSLEKFAEISGTSASEFATAFEDDALSAVLMFLEGLKQAEAQGGSFAGALGEVGLTSLETTAVLQTLATNLDDVDRALGVANKAYEENNALNKEFAQFADTFNAKLQTTKNRISSAAKTIGAEFLPALSNILTSISNLLKKGQELGTLVTIGNSIATTIETIRIGIQSLRIGFNYVTVGIRGLALGVVEATALISDALAKVTFGDLSASFVQESKNLRATAANLAEGIRGDLQDIENAQAAQVDAMVRIGQAWNEQAETAKASAETQKQAAEETAQTFKTAFAQIAASAEATGEELKHAFADSLASANTVAQINEIRATLERVWQAGAISTKEYTAALDQVSQRTAHLEAVSNGAFGAISRGADQAADSVSGIGANAIEAFEEVSQSAQASANQVFTAFDQALASASTVSDLKRIQAALKNVETTGVEGQARLTQAFNALDQQFADLGVTTKRAAEQMEKAVSAAFNDLTSAETQKQLEAAKQQLRQLFLAGVVSAKQFDKAMEQASKSVESLGGSAKKAQKEVSDAGKAASSGMARIGGVAAAIAAIINAAAAKTSAASAATGEYFETLLYGAPIVQRAATEIGRLRAAIAENPIDRSGAFGLMGMIQDINNATRIALNTFRRQKVEMLGYTKSLKLASDATKGVAAATLYLGKTFDASTKGLGRFGAFAARLGTDTLPNLIRAAKESIGTMDLLDKQQLSGLRAAIDSATRKLRGLRQEAEGTLGSLQSELAQLEGDYTELARRRAEERQAGIEAQLQRAEAYGDQQAISDLKEARKVAKEIESLKLAEARQREEQEAKRQTPDPPTPGPAPNFPDPAPQQQPTTFHRVKFELPSGRSVDADFGDPGDVDAMLEALQVAGARSLS